MEVLDSFGSNLHSKVQAFSWFWWNLCFFFSRTWIRCM